MRKEELRKLKRINATSKMVRLARNNKKNMKYAEKTRYSSYGLKKDTVYDVFIRCQTRGKYLMICIFFPEKVAEGELTPSYEIYCNPEGDEYITRILSEGEEIRWSEAMADNLDGVAYPIYRTYWYEGTEKRIWQSPEGMKSIQQFLETKKKGIFGLIEWQRNTRNKKTIEAEKRQQAPWDADMKLIPQILPSFKDWMLKEAVGEYFIFYEYSKKGATEGYCSHCRKMVPIEKAKHNAEGKCPKCGVKVKYKVSSKITTLSTRSYTGQLIQKIQGGIVIRQFTQSQWYRDVDYREPHSDLHENERILLFQNGVTKRYYYGLYKNKKHRWILDKDYYPRKHTYYEQLTTKLYKRNLASIKKTALKNSAIDLWDELPMDVAGYLTIENANPAIEKLAKIGMFHLAADLIRIRYDHKLLDEGATELAKMLKIDTAKLKRLKSIDGKVAHLKWYQYEKVVNRVWPDEMIKDFGDSNFEDPSVFAFLEPPLSYVKIWNYLKKQREISGESMYQLVKTWHDYINMAEKAKFNVKSEMIYKPKDLKAAHQKVLMILQSGDIEKEAKKLEKKWPKVNGNLPKLRKFEYSDGKYTILAPKGIIDIVQEGTLLRHCVHTCDYYFDRIQRDETYLFFLRKAEHEDIPWYTLEVEPSGNIRQKRTTGDNQNKDFEEAVKFLQKWQKVFRKRMTKEEKELGERANQARLEEYAKLRKDGNRVWHGKLAGQLLADVLEKDFMEAI